MPAAASRVVLVPPEAWPEEKLLDAARALEAPRGPLRAGDDVRGLVVTRVEPEGAAPDAGTVFDVEAAPRPTAGPLHLAALVDVSSSMGKAWDKERTRLDAARDALLGHLRGSGRSHGSVTLFTFAKDARLAAGPFPPGALAKGSIDLPAPSGSARAAHALDAALARLAARPQDGPQSVVLLTAGASEAKALPAVAARAKRLGIAVHVVVFAPKMDAALDELARATGGAAHVAALPLGLEIRSET